MTEEQGYTSLSKGQLSFIERYRKRHFELQDVQLGKSGYAYLRFRGWYYRLNREGELLEKLSTIPEPSVKAVLPPAGP